MKGYKAPIENDTVDNAKFRHVAYTGAYMQLVLMSLKPREAIGVETHGNDQFFRFEAGNGKVTVDGTEYAVTDGDCVIVPAGAKHNVENTSAVDDLKLYTIYSPPHHRRDVNHATKAAANKDHEEFDGITSE